MLMVFVVFVWVVLKEKFMWNYVVSFGFILLVVYFVMVFKFGGGVLGGY